MAKSDIQRSYEKSVLKDKPKGLTNGEYLYQGSTAKWSRGKYRKQAEAQEAKEKKAYRKDNPPVKEGDSPIEGTKEEYVRSDQVNDKLAARKRVGGSSKTARIAKKSFTKKTARKRVAGK